MLHLLVALRPKASPFLDAWTLRRAGDARGFDLYEGETAEGEPVRLVRAGIGKAAMAAAAGWLAGRSEGATAIWLNVGIAGHPTAGLGEPLMAHRVVDAGTGRASYPPLVVEPPCVTAEVRTVDLPEEAYAEDVAYDMEASAFVQAARRFATAEVVHCLKIVSDGPTAPASSLDRQGIAAALVAPRVATVETLHRRLLPLLEELRAAEPDPALLDELLSRHHYTVSDRVELRRQLLRHAALAGDEDLPAAVWEARRGREANRALRAWLDEKALAAETVTGDRGAPVGAEGR